MRTPAWTSTARSRARLTLPLPAGARQAGHDLEVTFGFDIFRPDPDRDKRIAITLAGSELRTIEIPANVPPPHQVTLVIPARLLGPEPYVVIGFRISDSARGPWPTAPDHGLMEIRLRSAQIKLVASSTKTSS